jgi:hypothetical protein
MKLTPLYLHLGAFLLSPEVTAQFESQSLPGIAHVDLWKHQPENEETELAYSLPALFIEFEGAKYEDFGVRAGFGQFGQESEFTLTLTFHLESHTWGATAMNHEAQATALAPLAMLDTLQDVLLAYTSPQGEQLFIENAYFAREGTNNPVSRLTYTIKGRSCA